MAPASARATTAALVSGRARRSTMSDVMTAVRTPDSSE